MWKIASGELHNEQLVDWVLRTGNPIILSTGLADQVLARNLVQHINGAGSPVAVLHCTTQYPTRSTELGMNVFEELKKEFVSLPVGLSDHSGEVFPSVIATYLGANLIEVHLTMHPKMFGPDVSSSLTPARLAELVRGVRFAWEMRRSPVDKQAQLALLARERRIFGRSLVAGRDINEGEVIDNSMILYKKPGGGLGFDQLQLLVGRRVKRRIVKDALLRIEDVI